MQIAADADRSDRLLIEKEKKKEKRKEKGTRERKRKERKKEKRKERKKKRKERKKAKGKRDEPEAVFKRFFSFWLGFTFDITGS